jgi:hypothetical protein
MMARDFSCHRASSRWISSHVRTDNLIRILSAFRTVAIAFFPRIFVSAIEHNAPSPDSTPCLGISRSERHFSELRNVPLAEALKTMDLNRLNGLETIDLRPLPPWRVDAFAEIQIEPDREIARERAETVRFTSGVIVYSDASGGEDHLGAAVVALDENQERPWIQYQSKWERWTAGRFMSQSS